MNYIHIHAPQPDLIERRIIYCPDCKRRRAMCVTHTPYYGVSVTCLTCGLRGEDGARVYGGKRVRALRIEHARALLAETKNNLEATPVLATTPAAGGRPVVGPRASEENI